MEVQMPDVQKHSVHTLVFRSLKRTHDMFISDQGNLPPQDEKAEKLKRAIKARDLYGAVMPIVHKNRQRANQLALEGPKSNGQAAGHELVEFNSENPPPLPKTTFGSTTQAGGGNQLTSAQTTQSNISALSVRKVTSMPRPKWHAQWKLYRVISGHIGWVRCVAVDPENKWFCSGSADRIIKIWDLASGQLKLSLTGHVSAVRGLAVSARHPYLFSAGEDKQVKCWDLEYNKVIRHYHGHLSAVYTLALHPTIDVLVTAGRDSSARVWDMRTKANIHVLGGHTKTIAQVICQAADPQIVTSSYDCTIRLWDLAAAKTRATLTHHKKSVRGLVNHPSLFMFASASPDSIKEWKFPDGEFIQTLSGHNSIVNCLAANEDGVLVSGGDNGSMYFWDWKTGYNFQQTQAPVQPGSMDSEAGIYAMTFDLSGSRLITAEADKTIKIYKEDENSSEETHPIHWKPDIMKRRRY